MRQILKSTKDKMKYHKKYNIVVYCMNERESGWREREFRLVHVLMALHMYIYLNES